MVWYGMVWWLDYSLASGFQFLHQIRQMPERVELPAIRWGAYGLNPTLICWQAIKCALIIAN